MYEIQQSQFLPLVHVLMDGVEIKELFSCFYIPIMLSYLVLFFVCFDFICNFYADISGLADR